MRAAAAAVLLLVPLNASAAPKRRSRCLSEASFERFRACQERELAAKRKPYEAKGKNPPAALVEKWEDAQRADARKYLAEHPAESLEGPAEKAQAEKPAPGSENDADFKARMWRESKDGQLGITPSMAREMAARLEEQQGGVSGEMRELLDAVSKDGAKLSPETMKKLKAAARSANASGLDLGVSPKMQAALLGPDDDGGPPPSPPLN